METITDDRGEQTVVEWTLGRKGYDQYRNAQEYEVVTRRSDGNNDGGASLMGMKSVVGKAGLFCEAMKSTMSVMS